MRETAKQKRLRKFREEVRQNDAYRRGYCAGHDVGFEMGLAYSGKNYQRIEFEPKRSLWQRFIGLFKGKS